MLNWFTTCCSFYLLNIWMHFFNDRSSSLLVLFKLIFILVLLLSILFSYKSVLFCFTAFLYIAYALPYVVKHTQHNLGLINTLSFWHPVNFVVILFIVYRAYVTINWHFVLAIAVCFWFILLGSWWSAQELLWQGWWNWDGVENTLLLLFIYLFIITHTKQNYFSTSQYILLFFVFTYIYFFVLNKTNLFKSIHSFTNSLYSNNSYWVFIYFLYYYVCLLFMVKKKSILAYYNISMWLLFYTYMYNTKSILFTKQFFFFYLNFFFLLFYMHLKSITTLPLHIILVLTLPYFVSITTLIYISLSAFFFKRYVYLHTVFCLFTFYLLTFLTTNNCIYLNPVFTYVNSAFNCMYINNLSVLLKQCLCYTYISNLVDNLFIFKNMILKSQSINFSTVIINVHAKLKITYATFYAKIFFFFIVTKVYYSKQKPRFKYYT